VDERLLWDRNGDGGSLTRGGHIDVVLHPEMLSHVAGLILCLYFDSTGAFLHCALVVPFIPSYSNLEVLPHSHGIGHCRTAGGSGEGDSERRRGAAPSRRGHEKTCCD